VTMRIAPFIAAAIGIIGVPGARAAVVQVAPNGFTVRHETTVDAPPAKVYDALVKVAAWWSPDHTYSGDPGSLSLDARAGGCFCERLKSGGSVEHLHVVYAAPPEALRMAGALGPLQASGVAGSMTWKLSAAGAGAKMELAYVVGGFIEGGFDTIAPAVDRVLGEQFQRLKTFVETGKPVVR
jgi:uncharacterized protein YndB with AHSA1/START domain